MSRKKLSKYLFAAIILAGIVLILIAAISLHTNYAKTEILNYTSDDGTHKLVIYMIGEPDFPFGSTHCRFDLFEGDKRITKYAFDLLNDGANANESNFSITQGEDNITVSVYGSEQDTATYLLYYDGTVKIQ